MTPASSTAPLLPAAEKRLLSELAATNAEQELTSAGIARSAIRPAALGVAALYLTLTPVHMRLLEPPANGAMAIVALIVAGLFLLLATIVRRTGVTDRYAVPIVVGMIAVPFAETLLHMALLRDVDQGAYVMLCLTAIGGFAIEPRWFLGTIGAAVAAYVAVCFAVFGGVPADFVFGLAFAILVASLIATMRRRSVDRLASAMRILENLALTDPLTGLINGRGFMQAAERSLAIAVRHNAKATLLYVDLDGLKPINDFHGHGDGDAAIAEMGAAIAATFRTEDLKARLHGDEFAVLMLDVETGETAMLRRLAAEIERRNATAAGRGWRLSYSIGRADRAVNEDVTLPELMDRADADMRAVKPWKR